MWFVEQIPLTCGYQFSSNHFRHYPFIHVPQGQIRIARYTTSFDPSHGRGYYAETYLRELIRRWKRKTVIKNRRILERRMTLVALHKTCLVDDVIRSIAERL